MNAPDYVLDAFGVVSLTDVEDVVQSAAGSATLIAGAVPGEGYVVVEGSGLETYPELDDAYLAGRVAAVTARIPAAAFVLLGADLTTPQVRTVILAHEVDGIPSYQAIAVTFHPAP